MTCSATCSWPADVTDTRRSQEILVKALRREREVVSRLKHLDRVKDDFVTTVSHELRTPMSSIIGSAEMLADGMLGELKPEQEKMIDVISRNGDRLLALADDLLLLATFDQTAWPEQRADVDLAGRGRGECAVRWPRCCRPATSASATACPREPVLVHGDATHLERAVTNLLTNAVKFTDGWRTRTRRSRRGPSERHGTAERQRHRDRHRRVRPRPGLRPVLPLGRACRSARSRAPGSGWPS